MTTSSIVLTFKSVDGKASSIKIPECKNIITTSDITAAADLITSSAALDCGTNQPAAILTGAKRVDTTSAVYKYTEDETESGDL